MSFLQLLLLAAILSACNQNILITESQSLILGDRNIKIEKRSTGHDDICFFNMHDDENTSVKAVKKYLRKSSGTLFYLNHGGSRNISFSINNQDFAFDPNRIFTDAGIKHTLSRHGAYTLEGHQAVAEFAEKLLSIVEIANHDIVVALHNNGKDEYSSSSYLPGRRYAQDAASVHQNQALDHDDFYFVTDSAWYSAIANFDYNVVLQNNISGTDDGSLSIYCGQKKIPYVNVEAQHGHKKEQHKMLLTLEQVIEQLIR